MLCKRLFPEHPPAGLIPRGYALKVALLWLSFIGIFAGFAGSGGPFAVLLPVSLSLFLLVLTAMIWVRKKERPLWAYKKAREYYQRHRYAKALEKLEYILRQRPDMERELFGAILICKQRTGDRRAAEEYCRRLIERGLINNGTDWDLLMEILCVFGDKTFLNPVDGMTEKLSGEVLIEMLKEYCFKSREGFR